MIMAEVSPIALVVETDELQRELLTVLLEESEMTVIQCASAEAALCILERVDGKVSMLLTDIDLAGKIDGVELAHFAREYRPHIHVIVTAERARARRLPDGIKFMPKPWRALDVLREAERSRH
jgi:DNA-binding NtrC family response regulator